MDYSTLAEKLLFIENSKKNVSKEQMDLYQAGISRNNAVHKLYKLIESNDDKPLIIQNNDGEVAILARKAVGKLLSPNATDKSVANGFKEEQHFAVASDIDNLFKNSIKILSHSHKKKIPNIIAIHRFIAPTYENYGVFITVREIMEYGKRIYSIEFIELGRLEGKLNRVKLNSAQAPATSSPTN